MTAWPSSTPGIAASCSSAITRSAGAAAAYTPNRSITYDPSAGGGTTNLTFDIRQGQWHEAWSSLAGTSTNCAGGATYAKSWLTCEETLDVYDKPHGWVFEVPAARQAVPAPLTAMGRFVHEAVAVDRQSGIIYETEDRGTSGLYRFLPVDKNRLDKGGRLQMLKVVGTHQADLRGSVGRRVHVPGGVGGHPRPRAGSLARDIGQPRASSARASTRAAPSSAGSRARPTARRIKRVYIVSTDGGEAREGQVWEYDPRDEQLRLVFESTDGEELDNPDNIATSPDGDIVLCEDGDLSGQRLQGLSRRRPDLPHRAEQRRAARREERLRRGLPRLRVGGGDLESRREVALRQHPDAGNHASPSPAPGARSSEGASTAPGCAGQGGARAAVYSDAPFEAAVHLGLKASGAWRRAP